MTTTWQSGRSLNRKSVQNRFSFTRSIRIVSLWMTLPSWNSVMSKTCRKFVRAVCLPKKDEPLKPGEVAKIATKGSSFRIQQDQLCSNKSVIAINSTVSFCTGDGKGGNDTCHGDSGGVFVREARRGDVYRWVATGIVSWGNGCEKRVTIHTIPGCIHLLTGLRKLWMKIKTQGTKHN